MFNKEQVEKNHFHIKYCEMIVMGLPAKNRVSKIQIYEEYGNFLYIITVTKELLYHMYMKIISCNIHFRLTTLNNEKRVRIQYHTIQYNKIKLNSDYCIC